MPYRPLTALLILFCGVSALLAQPDAQTEAVFQVKFSSRTDPTLISATLSVLNKDKKGKVSPEKNLVIEVMVGTMRQLKTIHPSDVEQIHFDEDKKGTATDLLVLTDGSKVKCGVKSSFKVKVKQFTQIIERADLKVIAIEPAKKAKEASPPPDGAPAETKSVSLYPFWEPPQVLAVKSDGDCCKLPKFCALQNCVKKCELFTQLNNCDSANPYTYRFRGPANFPQPRFDDLGQPQYVQGTIIYEGMQILVAHDGRYEVTFNASTPQVEVTLRMNLTFCPKGCEPIGLTLPTVSLTPEYRSANQDLGTFMSASNNYQKNWHVRLTGYSVELADAYRHDPCGEHIQVHRDGVARFGSLPYSR